jgi:uncharacterized ferritin-like protein (DUF455 family)
MELRHAALQAFALDSPTDKVAAVQALAQQSLPVDATAHLQGPAAPGRPLRPSLVEPQQVARRSPYTPSGHAALMHAIAHIEFNAINLALDAIWRFAELPEPYYRDWLKVAAEEAKHFQLLTNHLQSCGYDYGSFEAHDGLWTMCDNTRDDVVARMALVPRTLEARGLDATPIIQAKLRKVGSSQALAACMILDTILAEEVGHVAIGNQWYHWLCKRAGLDAGAFYAQAALRYAAPRPKPPFNLAARRAAGFTDAELTALQASGATPQRA